MVLPYPTCAARRDEKPRNLKMSRFSRISALQSAMSALSHACGWLPSALDCDNVHSYMDTVSKTAHLEPAPDAAAFDYGLAITKVASIAFPFLSPGITLFDLITTPARSKRLSDWCEELRLRFNDFSQKVEGMTPEALANSDAFISAFAQATQAAIKTHLPEKREALRNAVLNVALGKEPDEDRQQQFLALVDRFSEVHLRILKLLSDPAGYFRIQGRPVPNLNHVKPKMLINSLVGQAFPSLRKGSEDGSTFQFTEMILGDLVSSRLVAFEQNQDTWVVPAYAIKAGGGPIGKMTKDLGDDFLAFIAEPVVLK